MTTRTLSFGAMPRWWLLSLCFVTSFAMAGEGHDLTFQGDGSFASPHGDQAIQVAVYNVTTGEAVAVQSGTVSSSEEPTFAFTFPGVLEKGNLYDVHYWIDSNFGGGTVGQCDPVNTDHQWRYALKQVKGAVNQTVSHDASEQAPVCATFQ